MALPDEVQDEFDQRRARRLVATGVAAHTAGIPKRKCPYYPGSEAAEFWHQGWDEQNDLVRANRKSK